MKILFAFILCLNILLGEENSNTVKTSELELFLFKIGFESLLKDVDSTKNKSNLNEESLKKLNSKVEIIMNEIYKDKRVLKVDNNTISTTSTNKNDLDELKKEIDFLKNEINELKKEKKVSKNTQLEDSKKTDIYTIAVELANLRAKPKLNSNIVSTMVKGSKIEIESCDKYDWCKLKDEEKYISKFLLRL